MTVVYSTPPPSSPPPRLTARSMLSLGTDDFFAFWIASYRVGLPAGSGPPIRAATSTFLISFANILPRRASMTAFLCLVVAHLEWPAMAILPLPVSGPSPPYRAELNAPCVPGPGSSGGSDRRARPPGGTASRPRLPGVRPRLLRHRRHRRVRERAPPLRSRPARPTELG